MIVVSHDLASARDVANRVLFMVRCRWWRRALRIRS